MSDNDNEDVQPRKKQRKALKPKVTKTEVARKKALQSINKAKKPGECLKHMTLLLDQRMEGAILESIKASFHEQFSVGDLPAELQPPGSLTTVRWLRKVQELDEDSQGVSVEELVQTKTVVEKDVCVVLDGKEFVRLVNQQQLVLQLQTMATTGVLPSVLVLDVDKHIRQQKNADNREFRARVLGLHDKAPPKRVQTEDRVSRIEVTDACLDVQLLVGVTVRFCANHKELIKTLCSLTKAVAERPLKDNRLQSLFSFHAAGVGSSCRVDENGVGMEDLWRKQLLCFPNVTAEIAKVVIKAFPTPRHLIEAFQSADNASNAQKLVSELTITRGTGPLASTRRLGPELARKLYTFYLTENPIDIV